MSAIQIIQNVFADLRGFIVDVGCGSGRSTQMLLESTGGKDLQVMGLDIALQAVHDARLQIRSSCVSFIRASATHIPLRSRSCDAVITMLTLHELPAQQLPQVLREVHRILKVGGRFVVIDKIPPVRKSPSTVLTMLIEEAHHRALEYALGVRVWGVHKKEQIARLVCAHGFRLEQLKTGHGTYTKPQDFLSSWGAKTSQLLHQIDSKEKRQELLQLVKHIKSIARRHGYGPTHYVIAVFTKSS